MCLLFFFKHKTAYELRISDWSSDVCSSDLAGPVENIDDAPEQILEIGLDAGIDEAARQGVEDVGDGAPGKSVARERPGVGFILIGPMAVKLHFLEEIGAGAGLLRFAAFGMVGQIGHGFSLVWGPRLSRPSRRRLCGGGCGSAPRGARSEE